ncbi:hypothetical protein BaRGS_00004394, partial [Batillaria attramentaria]
ISDTGLKARRDAENSRRVSVCLEGSDTDDSLVGALLPEHSPAKLTARVQADRCKGAYTGCTQDLMQTFTHFRPLISKPSFAIIQNAHNERAWFFAHLRFRQRLCVRAWKSIEYAQCQLAVAWHIPTSRAANGFLLSRLQSSVTGSLPKLPATRVCDKVVLHSPRR